MAKRIRKDEDFGEIMDAKVSTKRIMGHGAGTRMDWLCTVAKGGFGFGGEKSITCIDMTVHATERGRPNVVLSTYMREPIRKRHFMPEAHSSPEQTLFAEKIRKNWNRLKNNQLIKLSDAELEEQIEKFYR